jgi:prefoldin alpha subunit
MRFFLLRQDLQLLTESYGQLRTAEQSFGTSLGCLEALDKVASGLEGERGDLQRCALLPLTSSVYVEAVIETPGRVLVDVGTGYYIEQPTSRAKEYYKRRMGFVREQAEKLTPAIEEKRAMVQVLTQVAQQKLAE